MARHIVGIGGTTRSGSSSEQALAIAMKHAEAAGAQTITFAGAELAKLPMYDPDPGSITEDGKRLVESLRKAAADLRGTLQKSKLDLAKEKQSDPALPCLRASRYRHQLVLSGIAT